MVEQFPCFCLLSKQFAKMLAQIAAKKEAKKKHLGNHTIAVASVVRGYYEK
jgi:hypothetical protein